MAATGKGVRLTALITGASSGIGKAFAREFARNGFDVILVARREARLREAAAGIAEDFGVEARILVADLADPAAPEAIAGQLSHDKVDVDALVNNAGFGVPGMLNDVEWQRHADCIEVMARAPAHLAYLLAPGMVRRGFGWIVNISSLTAFLPPHAGGTFYYPVKAFMLNFSLAHGAELRPRGVHVTAVCPGFTETGFQEAASGTVESVAFPKWLWLKPEKVARAGYRAVTLNRPICIPGRVDRLIALAFKLMPGPLARWLVRTDT